MSRKKIDRIGNRYGLLTVVAEASNLSTSTAWRCRCDCGEEVVVRTGNLTTGTTRSCGCQHPQVPDLTGQKFGRLTVVERTVGKPRKWRCLCECGAEVLTTTSRLRAGVTQSCGCLVSDLRHRSGELHPGWKTEVRYAAAHIRVQRAKGKASEHPCVDCGGPAEDWSYEGGDPEERVELMKGSPITFSLNIDFYNPRCRVCHIAKDQG